MQKHNQTTHSCFESWKVSCYKTLQQMTFLELKAKICYLQPQGKVIINNVWKNLTSTWREEWKKITISLSRAVNVSKIKSLILEMPGHIQLSVIISRWKDHLLSNNTSIDGSKKALVYNTKHPWLNRKKCCPYIDAWQANSLTNQDRGDRMCLGASASTPSCIFSPWPTCQHLHIF